MSNSYTIRYLRPGSTVWEFSTVDWASKADALLVASIWRYTWPDETVEVCDSTERNSDATKSKPKRSRSMHVTRQPATVRERRLIAKEWRNSGFENVLIAGDTVHGYADAATFARWCTIEAKREAKR